MEITADKLLQNKTVKKLHRKAKVLTSNKDEIYTALESVQEFFNRQPLRLFMCEKMKALGFDIN